MLRLRIKVLLASLLLLSNAFFLLIAIIPTNALPQLEQALTLSISSFILVSYINLRAVRYLIGLRGVGLNSYGLLVLLIFVTINSVAIGMLSEKGKNDETFAFKVDYACLGAYLSTLVITTMISSLQISNESRVEPVIAPPVPSQSSVSERESQPIFRTTTMLEVAKKEEAELHIQFNELAGFTGLTCCVVTVFLIILTCYCIVKLSTKSGDTGFSVEGFMYIFPLLYGTHVGLEGYVSWKNNLIIKQNELKGSHKVFVTFERYFPRMHAWYLLWRRLGSLAHNGKYSIMTVISIDLLDFVIQAVGLELLRESGVGWDMLWPYALLIAMNGLVTGLAILFFQERLKVEGVAALDVLFDIGYIYMSIEFFDGDGGFWTGFFPLAAAMVKTNDAWAKRVRRWCAVRYASLALDHDARQAREEGNFEEFLWQYYSTAMKLGDGRTLLKDDNAKQSAANKSFKNSSPEKSKRSIQGVFEEGEEEIKLQAPEAVKATLDEVERSSKRSKGKGIFSSQDRSYFSRTSTLLSSMTRKRADNARSDSPIPPESDRDSNSGADKVGALANLPSKSKPGRDNEGPRRGRLNSIMSITQNKGRKERRNSLEGSIVESIAGIFNRRSSLTKNSLLNKSDLLKHLLKGVCAKMYTQISVETVSSSSGVVTFYIQHSAESFLSFAKEQGFGYEQETLKVHTQNLRTIHTISDDKKMDFVLDQVIKKIDSVSAFVGVKSKEDLTLKPLVKKVKRKLVFLEGFFIESLNLNPEHYAKTPSESGTLSPRSQSGSQDDFVSPSGTLRGGMLKNFGAGLGSKRLQRSKENAAMMEKKHHGITHCWPDSVDLGDRKSGGCKITYLSCRGGVGESDGALRQRLEKLLCKINSYYVRLSVIKDELDTEDEITLSQAAYFSRLSKTQVKRIVEDYRKSKAAEAAAAAVRRGEKAPETSQKSSEMFMIKKSELQDLPMFEALVSKHRGEKKPPPQTKAKSLDDLEKGISNDDSGSESESESDSNKESESEGVTSERDSLQLTLFKTPAELKRDLRPSMTRSTSFFLNAAAKSFRGGLGGGGSIRRSNSPHPRSDGDQAPTPSNAFLSISPPNEPSEGSNSLRKTRSFRATPPMRMFSSMRGPALQQPADDSMNESGPVSAQSSFEVSSRNSAMSHKLSAALSAIEPSHFKSIMYLDREVDTRWNGISKIFGGMFLLIAAFLFGWVILENTQK
ncbi:hypothetical protein TrST_g7061 [Triparma strigata]|uniref:Uncharacterized protein n=1 Tax=Triparma strigata TaxID=1606541 RepID=A0A9W7BXE3_9STRA|nr:hypothetical protein TrST_g7061 [Triparma strigata]